MECKDHQSSIRSLLWEAGIAMANESRSGLFLQALTRVQGLMTEEEAVAAILAARGTSVMHYLLSKYRPESPWAPLLQHFVGVFNIVNHHYYFQLEQLLRKAGDHDLDVVLLKGGDLLIREAYYGLPRQMEDLDLLVRQDSLSLCRQLLLDLGYVQGGWNAEKRELIAFPEEICDRLVAEHYELVSFKQLIRLEELEPYLGTLKSFLPMDPYKIVNGKLYWLFSFDVHHNVLNHFDRNDLWAELRQVRFGPKLTLLSQSETDLLSLLISRFYLEFMVGKDRHPPLRFHDILFLCSKYHKIIDWDRLVYLGNKYGLNSPYYYVLKKVNELLDGILDADLVENFNPQNHLDEVPDLGDCFPAFLVWQE